MKKKQSVYTISSYFAGVGGIDLGFKNTKHFKTIYANEIDSYPVKTYEENFPISVDCRSIKDVEADDVPESDVMIAGFPCQAFSIAGYRQGFKDAKGRGELYFDLVRIYTKKKPKVIFLENVKNLVGHDHGNTFRVIVECLQEAGYHVKYAVLNAMEYGNTPQNRERIYIVAFQNIVAYHNFEFPMPIKLTKSLKDVIDFENKVEEKYYYREGKFKGDMYKKLVEAMDDNQAIYQWRRVYVRKNKSGVVPTLTANMGTGGHNVPLIKTRAGIRKLTPHECFNVQGFPQSFRLPKDMSDGRLYKQAGNSVCVSVIERIAENIYEAMTI